MKKIYYNILDKIESSGFVAYIVGGYVRDHILNHKTKDIDIITNATPKDLTKIFEEVEKIYEDYGSIKLKIKNEIIDITTFRKELSYEKNLPVQIEYTSSLEEDLKRRDFKMNTICMNKHGEIIDLLNGIEDIKNKIISPVKDVNLLFKEDKSRIIRAIRFACELRFNLNDEIIKYIKNNKEDLSEINKLKVKEELEKLFLSKKINKFFDFLKKYDLESYLGVHVEKLKRTSYVIGLWAQIEATDIPFTKNEKEQIKEIQELVNKKEITKYDIYKYGLYISCVAAENLGIPKKEINLIYTNLPIKGIIDINITSEEICKLLSIMPSKYLGDIIKRVEKEIIEGNIKNENEEIKRWIMEVFL